MVASFNYIFEILNLRGGAQLRANGTFNRGFSRIAGGRALARRLAFLGPAKLLLVPLRRILGNVVRELSRNLSMRDFPSEFPRMGEIGSSSLAKNIAVGIMDRLTCSGKQVRVCEAS